MDDFFVEPVEQNDGTFLPHQPDDDVGGDGLVCQFPTAFDDRRQQFLNGRHKVLAAGIVADIGPQIHIDRQRSRPVGFPQFQQPPCELLQRGGLANPVFSQNSKERTAIDIRCPCPKFGECVFRIRRLKAAVSDAFRVRKCESVAPCGSEVGCVGRRELIFRKLVVFKLVTFRRDLPQFGRDWSLLPEFRD